MCEFKNIITAERGYVAQCKHCQVIEVTYGTTMIHFGYAYWNAFYHYIVDLYHYYYVYQKIKPKAVVIDLSGTESIQMVLTTNELKQLYYLTEKADNEIKTANLLSLFDN